jgi:hypothetical protein
MTFTDRMRDHQRRCQPHLLRLRILARGEASPACPSQVTAEVRDATNAVIAEAEAAGRASLAAIAGDRRQSEAETFLWVRLARLMRAADQAADAARGGDPSGLRRHLDRFNTLTSAMWVVQHAVHAGAPAQPDPQPHGLSWRPEQPPTRPIIPGSGGCQLTGPSATAAPTQPQQGCRGALQRHRGIAVVGRSLSGEPDDGLFGC